MNTAAVVVIGREILTGKFQDENGPYLIARLRARGVDLRRLVVIDDVVSEIADEVSRSSRAADVVITTGGVGPTHDDLTFEGVAAALDLPLVRDPRVVALLERAGLTDDANLRMADLPAGAELIGQQAGSLPVVRVRNVIILPGIPSLVRAKMALVEPLLQGAPLHQARVFATDFETTIAQRLASVALAHPHVAIGSYPRREATDHRLIITLEGHDANAVSIATAAVVAFLDVVRIEREPV